MKRLRCPVAGRRAGVPALRRRTGCPAHPGGGQHRRDVRVNLTLTNTGEAGCLLKWQPPGSEDAPCSRWSVTASRWITKGP